MTVEKQQIPQDWLAILQRLRDKMWPQAGQDAGTAPSQEGHAAGLAVSAPWKYVAHVNGRHIVIPEEFRKYIGSNTRKSIAAKRIALWIEQKGLCHWCRCWTLLPGDPGYWKIESQKLSGLAATLDHLYSRLHPLRKYHSKYVMACHTCNGKRAKEECTGEFREEHLRRSRKGWKNESGSQPGEPGKNAA